MLMAKFHLLISMLLQLMLPLRQLLPRKIGALHYHCNFLQLPPGLKLRHAVTIHLGAQLNNHGAFSRRVMVQVNATQFPAPAVQPHLVKSVVVCSKVFVVLLYELTVLLASTNNIHLAPPKLACPAVA